MKKDKAIEILSDLTYHGIHADDQDLEDAHKLAIEALKRCRTLAQESPLWALNPLPGETKE